MGLRLLTKKERMRKRVNEREKEKTLIPAHSKPLYYHINCPVYYLHTHTHTPMGHNTREIPVSSSGSRRLSLWSCSISVLVFCTSPSLRTRMCSLNTDKINGSCFSGVEWEDGRSLFFFPQPSASCSQLYYVALRWVCCCTYILRSFL